MTLKQGFKDFLGSEAFKGKAKQKNSEGGKYRGWATRHKQGKLSDNKLIEILEQHGYKIIQKIEVVPPKKKKIK